jgi:LEA14-like dessication related protein
VVSTAGCAFLAKHMEPPRVSVVDLRIKSVTFFESAMEIDIRIQNPNALSFHTTGITFDLEINGRRLATGLSDASIKVPAMGSAIMPIIVYSNMLDVLRGVYSIQGKEKVSYGITGRIRLKEGRGLPETLPFKSKGEITIQMPDDHTSVPAKGPSIS